MHFIYINLNAKFPMYYLVYLILQKNYFIIAASKTHHVKELSLAKARKISEAF